MICQMIFLQRIYTENKQKLSSSEYLTLFVSMRREISDIKHNFIDRPMIAQKIVKIVWISIST